MPGSDIHARTGEYEHTADEAKDRSVDARLAVTGGAMLRPRLIRPTGEIALCLLLAFAGSSQTLCGQARALPQGITGVVADPSGAVVPKARGIVQNVQTGLETK